MLKETASGWDEDNVSRLAASLAHYTLLSIAPLIILAVAAAGLVFGQDAAREHVGRELASVVGSAPTLRLKANASASETSATAGAALKMPAKVFGLNNSAIAENKDTAAPPSPNRITSSFTKTSLCKSRTANR